MSTTETTTRNWTPAIKELGDKIVNLTGLQAKELSDYIKDVHGIEPASGGAVMMAAAATAPKEEEAAKPAGPSMFDVIIKNVGQRKIQVIKVLREVTGKSLKEASDLTTKAPVTVKENCAEEEANTLKAKLTESGAEVELKAK
jgi:large subunit ribosomal protein L7/L12